MEFTFNMQILKTVGQRTVRVSTAEAERILARATRCEVRVTQEKYTSNTLVVTVYADTDEDTIKDRIIQFFDGNEKYEGWFL